MKAVAHAKPLRPSRDNPLLNREGPLRAVQEGEEQGWLVGDTERGQGWKPPGRQAAQAEEHRGRHRLAHHRRLLQGPVLQGQDEERLGQERRRSGQAEPGFQFNFNFFFFF